MKITTLLVIALTGTALGALTKAHRPEYTPLVGAATALTLVLLVVGELTGLTSALTEMADRYGLSSRHLGVMLKIIGIAYLTQFGAQAAKDANQGAIALKLELGGRVLMLGCALPSVIALLELGVQLIQKSGS